MNKMAQTIQQQATKQLDNTKEIVEQLLREDPRCRDNDLWLVIQVWQKKQHINCFIPYDKLQEMISPETIRRTRQKIQNEEGLYPPTNPKIRARRELKRQAIESWAVRT